MGQDVDFCRALAAAVLGDLDGLRRHGRVRAELNLAKPQRAGSPCHQETLAADAGIQAVAEQFELRAA